MLATVVELTAAAIAFLVAITAILDIMSAKGKREEQNEGVPTTSAYLDFLPLYCKLVLLLIALGCILHFLMPHIVGLSMISTAALACLIRFEVRPSPPMRAEIATLIVSWTITTVSWVVEIIEMTNATNQP